jgi:heavy metal sensor kinase
LKHSISFRLTCWFSAVFLAGFVAFGLAMWLDLSYSLSKGRDRTLSRRSVRLTDMLQTIAKEPAAQRDSHFEEFADATPEGNLIYLYDGSGRRIYPKMPDPVDFPWPPVYLPPADAYQNVRYNGRLFRVLTRPVTLGSRQLIVRVAGQLEDNRQLLARFFDGLLAATPILLVASAFFGYLLSRRALRPVDRLTAAVRSISIGNLSGRLPVYRTGDELERLAETCNEMLARLEDAVCRINRFTADASHELRNPISFIRILAEDALRDPTLPEEARTGFEEILAEALESTRLLEDMLILARADGGRAEFHLQFLDLAEVVTEVCEKARPLAERKSQSLRVRTSNSFPLGVMGERLILRRLVWTLVDNAIKYTPAGGSVEVSLEATKAQARLKVSDTGIGIPKEFLPRIFDRFFRADPSRGQAEGSGLGLAIAKWIVDIHAAAISVESVEGAGTVFNVAFERVDAA